MTENANDSFQYITTIITLGVMISAFISNYQNRKMRKDIANSNVVVFFEVRENGNALCIVIKNFGNSPATNVSVSFSAQYKELVEDYKPFYDDNKENLKEFLEIVEKSKFNLTPQESYVIKIDTIRGYDKLSKIPLEVSITYKDLFNRKKKRKTVIDIESYRKLYTRTNTQYDIYSALNEISTTLKDISGKFNTYK